MAKAGKLTKLRSALKKINSFGNKLSRSNSAISSSGSGDTFSSGNLQTVYVGRTRREYQVRPELLTHPVMQDLLERSVDADGSDSVSIGCEVVLFDHLRWMIDNSDPQIQPLDNDLATFYAY